MPDMNGFEMLEYCRDYTFEIIFTTAYNEYAIQAIRHNALDYLLKPVNKQELINAVVRAKENGNKQNTAAVNKLLEQMLAKKVADRIALPTADGLIMVETKDIVYLESENNYTRFHLANGKTLFISKTLRKAELLLENNDAFFRIHNSYIINLKFLQRYIKGDGGEVVMANGQTLAVSRVKKNEFLERLEKL
jgi:two-component system LytT family response regulator